MATQIQNLIKSNSLLDDDFDDVQKNMKKIHIRYQKVGSHDVTIIEGLPADLNHQKVLNYFKKTLACNGKVVKRETNQVIQLQGDHRHKCFEFFVQEGISTKENIVLHGF